VHASHGRQPRIVAVKMEAEGQQLVGFAPDRVSEVVECASAIFALERRAAQDAPGGCLIRIRFYMESDMPGVLGDKLPWSGHAFSSSVRAQWARREEIEKHSLVNFLHGSEVFTMLR
jgi:hypothetical protein